MGKLNKTLILTAVVGCAMQLHAENIVFADNNVKALCVQKWDTDKDGEISLEEAAEVTSLGSVFRGKKNVVSFEELAFFTGLTVIDDYAFYQSSLQKVTFPASVTSIGEYAFAQSALKGELRIPGTLKTIGNYSFNDCKSLTDIVLEKGVESIGWHSISGPISTLRLPETINHMSSMAVDPFVNANPSGGIFVPVGDLYTFVYTEVPPVVNDYAFYYTFGTGHLVVPAGTIEAYKAVSAWAHFGEYLELGDVNKDGAVNTQDLNLLDAFLQNVTPENFNQYMADMNGDGLVDATDRDLLAETIAVLGIDNVPSTSLPAASTHSPLYNLSGQQVGENYRGIVIRNGRKFLRP